MQGTLTSCDALDSRQFHVAVKRLADSLSYGTDRSPFLGSGVEFVQSRPYAWGDSVKSIDWRVTARTGKFFVKEYEAPKRMPVYMLLDTSASMTISSIERSKYAVAVHIAAGLALACLDRVSPVGLFGVGENAIHVRPSLSKAAAMQWLHRLRHFRYDEPTQLADRIKQLAPSLNTRCLMIVLSDMHDDQSIHILKRLRQRHDCCVLQLRDPAERGLAGAGLLRTREAETGVTFVTHGRASWLNQQAKRNDLKRAGIDHLLIDTDRPFAHQLRHFFGARGLLGRGAR